jgi:methyl-accepting chemotaxis protein
MARHWTFGQKIAAGFAVIVALAFVIAGIAVYALRGVVESKDRIIDSSVMLVTEAESLRAAFERKVAASANYLLLREDRFLERMREAHAEFTTAAGQLRAQVAGGEERRMVDEITRDEDVHQQALDRVVALRRGDTSPETVSRAYEQEVVPLREELYRVIAAFGDRQQQLLATEREAASRRAESAVGLVESGAVVLAVLAALLALLLARAIGRQIGAAVGQVQSSSAELQAASNQQATGAREQATAMTEITTTISELLASSRQIAESAQRVATISEQTASAARGGGGSVGKAQESIADIRRQIEQVVGHMLELGKKSQQIGAVLEIVSELAEQTNILAINATIEAAGAGETGKRFAVVADEIRKLADRVAGSTKEIRALIEDVRGAVNTTVMATETGSKAVEAGSRQFDEVTSGFAHIVGLVTTTTEAAREIELSTKQQASAVEQVNVAVTNVAQASRETEASSAQTLATAGQLAGLSRDLHRLVKPQAAG